MSDTSMQQKLTTALDAALPSIVEGLKKELQQTVSWQVKNKMAEMVQETVIAWFKGNMVEEIHNRLAEGKDGLINTIPSVADSITSALVDSLTDTMTKKLESSYERRVIFEALFK